MNVETLLYCSEVIPGSYAKATYLEACGVLMNKAKKDIVTAYTQKELCGCGSCNNDYRRACNWHMTNLEGEPFVKAVFHEIAS